MERGSYRANLAGLVSYGNINSLSDVSNPKGSSLEAIR